MLSPAATQPQSAHRPHPTDECVITTRSLTKTYGGRDAVRDLDIAIPRGVVAGFVGPNGAGKTTTIRMLLGLVRPTSGGAEVLGCPITHHRDYLPRVGALIESPAFYPSLSGRDNLHILATLGGIPRRRIGGLIDLVGLTGRERDRVSSYSLGMKQRLGVAAALLPDPELLILDEPSNGLDPPGIIEMRVLLARLREEGRTIFVSSHLLGEVERVADWLVVLKTGRCIFAGLTEDILAERAPGIVVVPERSDQLETLTRIARDGGHRVTPRPDGLLVGAPREYAAELNRAAMKAGVTIVEIHPSHATLEETFLSIIGEPPATGESPAIGESAASGGE